MTTFSELPLSSRASGGDDSKKKVRGVLTLPRPHQGSHTPANLGNTTNLRDLLCEEGNRKAYNTGGKWKGVGGGQVNMTFHGGCWAPALSQTVLYLKKIIDKAAGEYTTEDTITNGAMHVGIRYMYDHEDVRAFLTLRERFEDSEDARNEEILDEHQIGVIVRALQDFDPPCLTGGKRRNLIAPEFVHEELAKLGKLGLNTSRVAYYCILQGIDLQPMEGQHAPMRRRIHSILEDFYKQIRARVGFIYGGLQRFGAYDTFIRSVEEETKP